MGLIKSINKRKGRKLEEKRVSILLKNAIKELGSELIVHNGPFKGMKYPYAKSTGSELYPKLLGSYEKELHPVIEEICQKNYSDIVDIGCAEGYYGVGLALRLKNAQLYLYDINDKALSLSQEMAKINQVDNRISFGNLCSKEILLSIPYKKRALIISDCEGCEKYLFTDEVVSKMSEHDFLIETHDNIDIEISSYLERVFSKTHDIHIVLSIDDIQKAKYYNYTELEQYDLKTKYTLLSEKRSSIMEWFYCTSKKQ